MSELKPHKRKLLNFSINRNMQFRMIGRICLILFFSQILSGLIFFYFSNQEITASFQMFHIKAQNFLDFLWPVIGAAVLISAIVGFLASLFFPKPIAGALYRIEEDLKKANAGDLAVRIKLRGGDQVTPVAAQINHLLSVQQKRFASVQSARVILEKQDRSGTEVDGDMFAEVRQCLDEALKNMRFSSAE